MIYHNIDNIITTYDINTDSVLTKIWPQYAQKIWERIETYGTEVNNYGQDTLSPHLNRISEDSRDFLLYLGHPDNVVNNFYDAIKISDLGKTHGAFNVNIWKLPDSPTQAQRTEKRKHTQRGLEVLADALKDAPQELLCHPHLQTVIPIHMMYHHIPFKENKEMGTMMEVACIVDSFDGDMDTKKITHGSGNSRTPQEQYDRMLAKSPSDKYHNGFRESLVHNYFDFRVKQRGMKL